MTGLEGMFIFCVSICLSESWIRIDMTEIRQALRVFFELKIDSVNSGRYSPKGPIP